MPSSASATANTKKERSNSFTASSEPVDGHHQHHDHHHPHPHHQHSQSSRNNSFAASSAISPRLPYVSGHIRSHDDDQKVIVDATDLPQDQKELSRGPSVSSSNILPNKDVEQPESPASPQQQPVEHHHGILMKFLLEERWTDGTWKGVVDDVLAGITLAMTAVPTSVAFGLLGKMNPLQSLYTSFWFGIIVAFFGGRPGTVPGNAGALTVLYPGLVGKHGPEPLYMASILAGVIFMIPGFLGISKYIKLLPASVMIGFVDGLGFILARGQISAFKDENDEYLTGERAAYTAMLTIICFVIMFGLPYITKSIPSTFVAIAVGTIIEHAFQLGTVTVGNLYDLSGSFPIPRVPNMDWGNSEIVSEVITLTFIIPIIGLVESLLMVHVCNVLTETKGSFERESLAMGAANIVSGLWGGYAGCTIVGLTILNFHSGGGYRRLATFVCAILLIVVVLGAWRVINLFPMGSLSAALFGIAVKSFDIRSIDMIFNMKIPVSDSIIILVTTIVSVFTDLAVGCGVGLVVALIFFAWDIFQAKGFQIKSIEVEEYHGDDDRIEGDEEKRVRACVLKLQGIFFFFSASEALAKIEDVHLSGKDRGCSEIILDFGDGECSIRDFSVIDSLNEIATIFTRHGRRFHLRNLDLTSSMIASRAVDFAGEVHNDKDGVFDRECIVVLEEEEEQKNDDNNDESKDEVVEVASGSEADKKEKFYQKIRDCAKIVVFVYSEELGVNVPLHPFTFEEFKKTTKFTKAQKLARFGNVSFKGTAGFAEEILVKRTPEVVDDVVEMFEREMADDEEEKQN